MGVCFFGIMGFMFGVMCFCFAFGVRFSSFVSVKGEERISPIT